MPLNVVMQRAAFLHRHADHGALGPLGGFADRLRHLPGFTGSVADPALLIADPHQGCEHEPAPALHLLGDAVDRDHLFDDPIVGLTILASAPAIPSAISGFPCHSL